MLANAGTHNGLEGELVVVQAQFGVPGDDLTAELGAQLSIIGRLMALIVQYEAVVVFSLIKPLPNNETQVQ